MMLPVAPNRQPLADEVHVWVGSLVASADIAGELAATLTVDERARVDRFAFPHLQRRFIVGRGLLRYRLAGYLGLSPREVEFSYEAHGKPVLGRRHDSTLTFNISHSGDLALLAFARGHQVGVDVEALRPMPDALTLAERFFSASERRTLGTLPAAQQDAAFFACWTRKEAYIKAIGEGLSCPLESFDVSVAPGDAPRLVSISGSTADAARWTVLSIDPTPGFVGAVAIEHSDCRLVLRQAVSVASRRSA